MKTVTPWTPTSSNRLATAPGELSYVEAGVINTLKAPRVSENAYNILAVLDRDQQKVVPQIFHGLGSKYESGYGQAQRLMHTSVSLLTGLIAEWEKSVSNMLDRVIELVANVVEEPVGILGNFPREKSMKTIKPAELNPSAQHFLVTLDAKTPEEKEHRWRLGMDSWVTGSISLETLHTDFYGIDHITEKQRILIEKALNHPAILKKITEEAITDVGMRDLLGMIQEGKFNQPRLPIHGIGGESNKYMRFDSPVTMAMPRGEPYEKERVYYSGQGDQQGAPGYQPQAEEGW